MDTYHCIPVNIMSHMLRLYNNTLPYTKRATHLVNAFLLVHHPSSHRIKNSCRALFYTAVKLDPGDPLIYCSSVQEREGGREERGRREREREGRGGVGGDVQAGEERVGRDGSGGGERNGGACSVLPQLSSSVICSSIFLTHFLSASPPMLLMGGVKRRNSC